VDLFLSDFSITPTLLVVVAVVGLFVVVAAAVFKRKSCQMGLQGAGRALFSRVANCV
jgi:hypothetical protein